MFDQTLDAGINLNWTIFDGFNITANYQRLKELERQGETNTRIAIEDLIANIAAEYYNYVQQKIRLKNFRYAVSLSKERLRIVEERYHIGNFSRLDYQQAKVDFNADSAQYMKQQELLHTSRIQLNELMANKDVDQPFIIQDSLINVTASLNFEELWNATLTINASLLRAEQNNTLARLDYKKVCSRDYPYVKMNGGYGYTLNKYDISANSRRSNLGLNFGVTVGFNLFDGNRRRERKNARIAVQNARLEREQLEQALRAHGVVTWTQLVHLRTGKALRAAVRELLDAQVAAGHLISLTDSAQPDTYLQPSALAPSSHRKPADKVQLLSPFDNAVIHRDRLQQLFGFNYRLESYTPAAKRIYGYFCLPILWRGRFVGRVDCKANRTAGRLVVLSLHLESCIKADTQFSEQLTQALQKLAKFCGCNQVQQ